jgi:hypothetical protein
MHTVNESIFSNGKIVIPMKEVQFIENQDGGGLVIVFKDAKWSSDKDAWENNAFIPASDADSFMQAWCFYRHELEIDDLVINSEEQTKEISKPDVIRYFSVCINELKVASISSFGAFLSDKNSNVKLTFDGETNKLKSAEVIND